MSTTVTDTTPRLSVAPGLKGETVATTHIGEVRGSEGFFHYREYDATDVARSASFETACALVLDGTLDGASLAAELAEHRNLATPDLVTRSPSVLRAYQAALARLADAEGFEPTIDLDAPARRRDAVRVAAVTPTLLALASGAEPSSTAGLGHAEYWLRSVTDVDPTPAQARALETYLTLTIDHGFNNSTFTARTVTSTGADVAAAVLAAVSSFSGPLHGGAPSRALEMIEAIGDPAGTEDWVLARLAAGDKIMGFGHAVYRADDPRSVLLREVALGFDDPLVERAVAIESRVLDVLRDKKPGATIVTNVEYYAAVVLHLTGVAPHLFTPTFLVARVFGWAAHVLEQAADNKIIRPSAAYAGPPAPVPLPSSERSSRPL